MHNFLAINRLFTSHFFYKSINNLLHEHILTETYEGIKKKNIRFGHIGMNTNQYRQSFLPKTIGAWNQLPYYADCPTLENFRRTLLSKIRP